VNHDAPLGAQPGPWVERRQHSEPMQNRTQVLVCGNQSLYRAAMSSLIERDRRLASAAECTTDIADVSRALAASKIDLVLIDYDLGSTSTIEGLEKILDAVAPRPALVLSTQLDAEACQRAVKHGASGLVFKESDASTLLAAIDSAMRGQVWLDRALLTQVFDDSHSRRPNCSEKTKIEQLTPRELEIMRVACTGVTNKQIARTLNISEATVRHHLGSIFSKLGVSTRSELVVFGYRHNLASSTAPTSVE
jgi:two-component system nitrate/nitrite response regulator NarL